MIRMWWVHPNAVQDWAPEREDIDEDDAMIQVVPLVDHRAEIARLVGALEDVSRRIHILAAEVASVLTGRWPVGTRVAVKGKPAVTGRITSYGLVDDVPLAWIAWDDGGRSTMENQSILDRIEEATA